MTAQPSDERSTEFVARLADARARTVARVGELTRTFDQIASAAALAPPDDEHDPDGSTVGFERAQVSSLLAAARNQLDEIDAAIARLRRGDFGRCGTCDRLIAVDRLRARPAARSCISCAQELSDRTRRQHR